MEKIIFRVIVFTSACCLSRKHVHVQDELSWAHARAHCRNYYTDLSPLTNELEEEVFRESVGENDEGWIGVYWNQTTSSWKWSGGDDFNFWIKLYSCHDSDDEIDPPCNDISKNVYWTWDKWLLRNGEELHSFFCLNLMVVQEEKTWEEALEHCTRNQGNLSSLLSETENLLATNEIQQTNITERVWIGLRYLGDEWLWVNGDPLEYWKNQLGGEEDLDQCLMKTRCGALTKKGKWENWDCQEKLHFICG